VPVSTSGSWSECDIFHPFERFADPHFAGAGAYGLEIVGGYRLGAKAGPMADPSTRSLADKQFERPDFLDGFPRHGVNLARDGVRKTVRSGPGHPPLQ
jgi:hypothetical protein